MTLLTYDFLPISNPLIKAIELISDSSLLIVSSASTHRYDLSSDTPHPHLRVRMNIHPKRASTLRLPEPLVSPAQPIPAEVLFILCGELAGVESAPEARAGGGGGHLLLVVVLQHMISRAYCPPPTPRPFPRRPHPLTRPPTQSSSSLTPYRLVL